MICQNCGTQNAEISKFCIKCGTPINVNNNLNNNQSVNMQSGAYMNIMDQPVENNMSQQFINNNISQTVGQSMEDTIKIESDKVSFGEYFSIIFEVLLKPSTALKENLNKFSFQNSVILSVIVAVIAMLITLIKTIINTVHVTTGGFLSEAKTQWVWENIKQVDFIKVIGTNFLVFLGVIFAIACVYYIAGLIVKKQSNFARLLGICAVSVVPLYLSVFLVSSLFSMIYEPLGIIVSIIGAIYTLLIGYEAINNEITLDGNNKLYFNLICLSLLIIGGYYLYMNFFVVSIPSDVGDILDLIK